MIPDEKSVPPAIRIPALKVEDIADIALSDLTRPPAIAPDASVTDIPRPSEMEIRPVLEALAHSDPLDAFLHRKKSLALAAAQADAAASGMKVSPPKATGGAHPTSHNTKAHQPSQKWVTRRFA